MRKLLLIVCALTLVAGAALAKAPLEKPVQPYNANSRAAEVEPNDDFASANALTIGDDMNAEFGIAGDIDYFAINLLAGDVVTFETHPGDVDDTQLTLFDAAFVEVGYNDDGGDGLYSLIDSYVVPADGVYYAMVNEYGYNGTGTYILSATMATPPPPAPENDVCTGAIDLNEQGLAIFDVDLADGGYTNAEGMGSGGCTGYSTNGPEAFYKIYLVAGQTLNIMEDGTCDMAMYVFTDCADPFTSCVAGSDTCCAGSQEAITYEAAADGWYYIGIDAYTSSGCPVTVTFDQPVSNEDVSFGTLKANFR